jgi:hypothetical protein
VRKVLLAVLERQEPPVLLEPLDQRVVLGALPERLDQSEQPVVLDRRVVRERPEPQVLLVQLVALGRLGQQGQLVVLVCKELPGRQELELRGRLAPKEQLEPVQQVLLGLRGVTPVRE